MSVVARISAAEAKVRAGDLAAARKATTRAAAGPDAAGHLTAAPTVTALDELASSARPDGVLVIGSVNDVSLYRDLSARRDRLPREAGLGRGAATRCRSAGRRRPRRRGGLQARITAFLGARGGVGTTSIAVATAWYFVNEFHQRASLIDLDLHFGTLALASTSSPAAGCARRWSIPSASTAC